MMLAKIIYRPFERSSEHTTVQFAVLLTLVVIFLMLGHIQNAAAGTVTLTWDSVNDSRVDSYEVHYGHATGQYDSQVDTTAATTSVEVAGLGENVTYYFAVRACDQSAASCSTYSNEVNATTGYSAPVADFTANLVSGDAPLIVTFSDQSSGDITSRNWSFGDGGTGAGALVTYTYSTPGTYTVSLTVGGPGGTNTKVKPGYIQVTAPASVAPAANFSANVLTGIAPLAVAFHDDSTGQVTAWNWDFGDGTTSTAQNPSHTYQTPGTYSVRLTVTGPGGSNTVTGTNYITVVADTGGGGTGLVAAYGFDESGGTVALDASGNNNDGTLSGPTRTSTGKFGGALEFDGVDDRVDLGTMDIPAGSGLTLSVWARADDFAASDGRLISKANGTAANDHLWMLSTYTGQALRVRLKVGGSTTTLFSAPGAIVAGEWTHVAATYDGATLRLYKDATEIAMTPLTGVPDTDPAVPVALGNQPQGGQSFDGLIDEVRIYSRALSPAEIQADMVSPVLVVQTSAPGASFGATPTSGTAPLTVDFSDASTGEITSWSWDFGDGDTSAVQNPSHIYQTPGTYSVRLTVTGPGGTDTVTANIVVEAPAPVASFGATPTSGTAPLTVDFSDTSTGEITSWSWNLGDGGASTVQNPSHTYQTPGTYSVRLTVTGPGGSNTVTRTDYITVVADTGGGGTGLVAAYGFDESGGTVALDASGNNNDGTLSGPTRTSTGKFGGALSFDGVNDWVSVADSATLDLTSAMTLEAWVNPSALSGWRTVLLKETSDGLAYALEANDDAPRPATYIVVGGQGHSAVGTAGIPVNTWTHLAATYDGADLRLFVNGSQVGALAISGTVTASASPLRIGGNALWGEYFNGLIDEVRIYDRALSPAEIQADMVSPVLVVQTPAPVASFGATPTSGTAPLTVDFSDTSTGEITSWSWDFGDGATSTEHGPRYIYQTSGTYSVSLTVTGPGGADTVTKTAYVVVQTPAPVAEFTATPTSGTAPLTVDFSDTSTGEITSWSWTFGDGGTSTQSQPTHTYTQQGVYTVALTASGIGGSNTLTRTDYIQVAGVIPPPPPTASLPVEIGDVAIDDQWQRVEFQQTFSDPVVVAKALSYNGTDPAVVRIKGIDANGFWIRVQEWDYLDGQHPIETAGYLVMERGRRQLPDGVWVEAGSVTTSKTNGFQYQAFSEGFAEAPVVFAAVTTINEEDAVNARLKNINANGFYVGMREQESNRQKHGAERIDFIAWPASTGEVAGLRYDVGSTGKQVNHKPYGLSIGPFNRVPVLVADMQTTNGGDSASLRWNGLDVDGVDFWVQEEQSKDQEMNHVAEDVGYFIADVVE